MASKNRTLFSVGAALGSHFLAERGQRQAEAEHAHSNDGNATVLTLGVPAEPGQRRATAANTDPKTPFGIVTHLEAPLLVQQAEPGQRRATAVPDGITGLLGTRTY